MNWEDFNREIRADFPALQRVIDGNPVAFLDGPGGYQVPQVVIDAVVDYLVRIGIAPYNSRAELTRVIESLRDDAALAEFSRQKDK